MRYLVLGAGALGGYFGGMLLKGGADVTFLVRPARAAQLRRDGLVVKTQDGGELRIQAKTIQQGQVDGPYDVVLLCCKAYDLDGAMAAIAPAMGDQSVILPLLNGVRHIDALTERFGPERADGHQCCLDARRNYPAEPGADQHQRDWRIRRARIAPLHRNQDGA